MSALLIGETTNQLKKEQIKSKLLVFEKMEKPDYPGKNLLKQRTNKEPTNSTHTIKKGLEIYTKQIPGNIEISELQKIALLGTSRILRKTLSIKLDRLLPHFSPRPKEWARLLCCKWA